jgi:hypothetical protein
LDEEEQGSDFGMTATELEGLYRESLQRVVRSVYGPAAYLGYVVLGIDHVKNCVSEP